MHNTAAHSSESKAIKNDSESEYYMKKKTSDETHKRICIFADPNLITENAENGL